MMELSHFAFAVTLTSAKPNRELQRNIPIMPHIKPLLVDNLKLDLANYRTVPQKKETESVHALIAMAPEYFWALAHSLIDEGYNGTENIIVLKTGTKDEVFTVKEGNRRIGALKLLLGKIPAVGFSIPTDLAKKITALTPEWKASNAAVPCNIFEPKEAKQAERLVSLIHAKGEKAGRLNWNAVARARYNRDETGASEPALDLLETYLATGKNVTALQKERWGGEYPISVLAETIKRVAPRLGFADSRDVANQFLKSKHRGPLELMLQDIGLGSLDFPTLRDVQTDFGVKYGIPLPAAANGGASGSGAGGQSAGGTGPAAAGSSAAGGTSASAAKKKGWKAVATNDPKSVIRALKKFAPRGNGREKLMTLLVEARSLNLTKHPHAFCFILRSMFELSAKAYCADHKAAGLSAAKKDSTDKHLVDLLNEITRHLTNGGKDTAVERELHGPIAELSKPAGFLSVTSMNQLVHNKKFTVDDTHISTLFHNIYPLLEAMNR
jgi:hypothetical protein